MLQTSKPHNVAIITLQLKKLGVSYRVSSYSSTIIVRLLPSIEQ